MKKNLLQLLNLLILTITLASCGSSGDGATDSNGKYTGVFSDTAVTSFFQTSNIAHRKQTPAKRLLNFVIPSAYAAGGNGEISCFEGDSVSFSIDLVAPFTDVDVTTTCGNNVNLEIRRALLVSMENKRIIRVDASSNRGSFTEVIQLNPEINFWNQYSNIPNNTADNGATGGTDESTECQDTWTIDSTGTVTIAYDSVNSTGTEGECTYNESGATEAERNQNYTKQLPFKFENGRFVLDGTGTGDFSSPGDIVYFCIDDNSDNTCD